MISAFILAGGKGSRVTGPISKIELPIAGVPCYKILLNTVKELEEVSPYIVGSPYFQTVQNCHVIQEEALGTGHAIKVACESWKQEIPDQVLILYADVPLIKKETITNLINQHVSNNQAITLLSFNTPLPNGYGRIVEKSGLVQKILDSRDDERPVFGNMLAHSGIMIVKGAFLWDAIKKIQPTNQQQEYYATDIVCIAQKVGLQVKHISISEDEAQGLNTWSDWVKLEKIYQLQLREHWFNKGALVSEFTNLHHDTQLEKGVVVESFVTFGPQVSVGEGTRVLSHSHISESTIGKNCLIGPFAHIHNNSEVGAENKIGNFVEVTKAKTSEKVKAKHMSYLGNVTIKEEVNIGGGVVFANYDGLNKHETLVGKETFIGANSTIIAPLEVGKGVVIAGGSTITKSVEDFSLAFGRPPQVNKINGAKQTSFGKKAKESF